MQAVLAQITWYHNLAILERLDTSEDRIWYTFTSTTSAPARLAMARCASGGIILSSVVTVTNWTSSSKPVRLLLQPAPRHPRECYAFIHVSPARRASKWMPSRAFAWAAA